MSKNPIRQSMRQRNTAASAGRAPWFTGQKPVYGPALVEKPSSRRERRSGQRYPVTLPVQYETQNKVAPRSGLGRVVNMSSSGLLLESDHPLDCGATIRLRIEWPALLNNAVPLALHIHGRTLRANGAFTAIQIMKSEFRIRRCERPQALRCAG